MLLQLAAPLIHAHKNENFGASFHLPEFEQISLVFEKNALSFVPAAQGDQIVTVSAGVKNNKRRVLLCDDFRILILSRLVIFSWFQHPIIHFFVEKEPINLFRFLNLNAPPRAPPFTLFR